MFLSDLPFRFIFALIRFTFGGWIGWVGIVLVALKVIGVVDWPWWVAALPLEYGVVYCFYMTIDGALHRAGLKDIGRYARLTQGDRFAQLEQSEIQAIIAGWPERIGATIDAWSADPFRRRFAQALLDTALEPYFLLQLAMVADKKVNAHVTIARWRDAGLTLPAEGTPEFFPYGDSDKTQSRPHPCRVRIGGAERHDRFQMYDWRATAILAWRSQGDLQYLRRPLHHCSAYSDIALGLSRVERLASTWAYQFPTWLATRRLLVLS